MWQLDGPAEMVQVVAGCRVLSLVGNVTLFYIKARASRCSGRRRGVGRWRRHCFWPRRRADPLTFRRRRGLWEAGGRDQESFTFGEFTDTLKAFQGTVWTRPPFCLLTGRRNSALERILCAFVLFRHLQSEAVCSPSWQGARGEQKPFLPTGVCWAPGRFLLTADPTALGGGATGAASLRWNTETCRRAAVGQLPRYHTGVLGCGLDRSQQEGAFGSEMSLL